MNLCTYDCARVCNGTAVFDCNGVCGGLFTGICGECNTTIDPRNCVGMVRDVMIYTSHTQCPSDPEYELHLPDCAGNCIKTHAIDGCGGCVKLEIYYQNPDGYRDCMGVCGGMALLDKCSCFGGTSPHSLPMIRDCNDDCNGTATLDDCGRCFGGNSSQKYPTPIDCNNVCDGLAVMIGGVCMNPVVCDYDDGMCHDRMCVPMVVEL